MSELNKRHKIYVISHFNFGGGCTVSYTADDGTQQELNATAAEIPEIVKLLNACLVPPNGDPPELDLQGQYLARLYGLEHGAASMAVLERSK